MNTTSTAAKAAVAPKHSARLGLAINVNTVEKRNVQATIAIIFAIGSWMKNKPNAQNAGSTDDRIVLRVSMVVVMYFSE